MSNGGRNDRRRGRCRDSPVSQICAFNVFPSTLIDRVANSTPMVDFVSRLNSLRVNRESTVGGLRQTHALPTFHASHRNTGTWEAYARLLYNEFTPQSAKVFQGRIEDATYDFPTPESPIRTT